MFEGGAVPGISCGSGAHGSLRRVPVGDVLASPVCRPGCSCAGALALCAGEALLPVQGCVALLGPRLKAAALTGILHLCTQAMQRG